MQVVLKRGLKAPTPEKGGDAKARAHVLAIGLSVLGLRRAYQYRLFLTARLLRTHCRSRFHGTEVLSAGRSGRVGGCYKPRLAPKPGPPPAHCRLVSDSISIS